MQRADSNRSLQAFYLMPHIPYSTLHAPRSTLHAPRSTLIESLPPHRRPDSLASLDHPRLTTRGPSSGLYHEASQSRTGSFLPPAIHFSRVDVPFRPHLNATASSSDAAEILASARLCSPRHLSSMSSMSSMSMTSRARCGMASYGLSRPTGRLAQLLDDE
jgi:hypothetical protein